MQLHKALTQALVEKDVENAWRKAIAGARPQASICSPFGCDGLVQWDDVRMLVEFKLDTDMFSRTDVARVLGQVVLYVKRFELAAEPVPNVIMLADRNECCVLPTAALSGFLVGDYDWAAAPSLGDEQLVQALASGLNFVPHVYAIGRGFKLGDALERAEALANGAAHVTRATLANVGTIFAHWSEHVFKGKLGPVDQVDVFLRCLFDPTDVYLHPKRKGVLVVPGYADGVQVHADRYQAFFDTFAQGYKPSEVEAFYAAKDRLIDDDARRRQGAFFTPRIWVDEAHRTIESVLGPKWREECIVWDPAAGTGNLTRDYDFADLILSTAERSDVETIRSQGYNPGASVFQYDFLNPDAASPFFPDGELSTIPQHVDAQLRAAAKAGKRLVFIMNPPYGTAGINGSSSRAGISATEVNARMKRAKIGKSAQQLYAQFMWQAAELVREYGFASYTIALFSGVTFLASGSYQSFRNHWYSLHAYQAGWLFRASYFADVADTWGIGFTVWTEGVTDSCTNVSVRLREEHQFGIRDVGDKLFYTSTGRAADVWLGSTTHSETDTPKMSSGLAVCESYAYPGQAAGGLGVLCNMSNSVSLSGTNVYLLSCRASHKPSRGVDLLPSNTRRCAALYAARKLVTNTWANHVDEYLAPDETAPGYAQWVDDAHVFALLDPKNNCTAMRAVAYKGREWMISNHLFWLTRAEALAALDTAETPALYRDCKLNPTGYVVPKPDDAPREQWEQAGDPYLAHVLQSLDLSPEARDVLDRLRALWVKSLPLRESFAAARPELHLGAWDAGVYQLKHLWREHFAEDWEALRDADRKLADKLRPGVYDYGFLLR